MALASFAVPPQPSSRPQSISWLLAKDPQQMGWVLTLLSRVSINIIIIKLQTKFMSVEESLSIPTTPLQLVYYNSWRENAYINHFITSI
jgi:hypothetical protein